MDQARILVSESVMEARASDAEQCIRKVKQNFEKIAGIVSGSASYWNGSAGDAHRREFQEYRDETNEAIARLSENVTDLRKMAGIYREAQSQAEQLSRDLPADIVL